MLASHGLVAFFATSTAASIYYAGVAESGGEFGAGNLPGTFGVDYEFINQSTIDIWVDQNHINLFRVAFLLERMCPPSSGLGSTFDATYFGHFNDAINYITNVKGAYAILDPHNYMRYNDPSSQPSSGSIIGDTSDSTAATTQQFQAFWNALAGRFVSNEKVIFGIMNEPHDMPTSLVLQNDQAAINGIRASGAQQLILAPGNGYTGGHSWTQTTGNNDEPSSAYLNQLNDPSGNTAIDIHEYMDYDFSGGHSDCSNLFSTYLPPLTTWLQQNNLKAMITEFSGADNAQCDSALQDALDYMSNNAEYIGWSAWAAGPLWGSSPNYEPGSTNYYNVWQKVIQPKLPNTLQINGVSSING